MRARRAIAALAALALLAAGCSNGSGRSLGEPAPATARDATAATGLDPVWLVRSTGTRDATSYEAWTQVLFVDGDIAVYAVFDTALGVALDDGETVWSSPVDLRGEVSEHMGTEATAEHHWHFAAYRPYDDTEAYGDRLFTVDVRDGTLVNDVELPTQPDVLTSIDGADYLGIDETLYRVTPTGEIQELWSAPRALAKQVTSIDQIMPVPGTTTAVLRLRTGRNDIPTFVGFDLASGTELWQRPGRSYVVAPAGRLAELGLVADGRFLTQRVYQRNDDEEWTHLWVLDPATGEARSHQLLQAGAIESTPVTSYRLWYQDVGSGNPHAVQAVEDDLILRDGQTIVRLDPMTAEVVWKYDYTANWHLGPLSADGRHLFVNAPDARSGSILMLDAATGERKALWGLPTEHAEGLTASPLVVPTDDGLVLGRNQGVEGDTTDDLAPTAALNDLGFLAFRY
ncbi:PQQ-binding-like beta-propeller repeat protein [Nocardioides sp. R1-1]|uniref:outer membrane protein assembly factor BamB family protein n=1 Tax=Nocardioides sp. R1-1 TaxID=3383502 RepID=UPI0038D0F115